MLRKPRPKGRFFAWRTAAAIKIVEAGANLVALLEIKPAAARNHFLYLIALTLRFACPLKFFIYKLVSDDPVDKSPCLPHAEEGDRKHDCNHRHPKNLFQDFHHALTRSDPATTFSRSGERRSKRVLFQMPFLIFQRFKFPRKTSIISVYGNQKWKDSKFRMLTAVTCGVFA